MGLAITFTCNMFAQMKFRSTARQIAGRGAESKRLRLPRRPVEDVQRLTLARLRRQDETEHVGRGQME